MPPPNSASKGVDQRLALRLRQGCREHDRAAAETCLELEEPLELLAHIGVIGMGLVHHQHPLGEAVQAKRLVARRQHREKGLVDGADADIGEKRLSPAVGEPGGAGSTGPVRFAAVLGFDSTFSPIDR